MRISDWSSDVCSSDLRFGFRVTAALAQAFGVIHARQQRHRMIRTECCGFALDQCAELCECLIIATAVETHGSIALRDFEACAVIVKAACRARACMHV